MLREKIVASASKKMVVVTDSSKQVAALGKFPLPVEVIGFAEPLVAKRITDLGARVVRRLDAAGKPYLTDEGHHILDCHFGKIDDPPALNAKLCDLPGIVEHGLFVGMASVLLMAKAGAVEVFRP
jgi:ribose 5-phosphate isomerase A